MLDFLTCEITGVLKLVKMVQECWFCIEGIDERAGAGASARWGQCHARWWVVATMHFLVMRHGNLACAAAPNSR